MVSLRKEGFLMANDFDFVDFLSLRSEKSRKYVVDEVSRNYISFLDDIKSNDFLAIILRGHLYVEHELTELMSQFLRYKQYIKMNKFISKLELASALGAVEEEWIPALKKLNHFRNKFAHDLRYEFNEQSFEDFLSSFSLEMKKSYEKTYTDLKEHYGDNLQNKLGVLISHLWVLLKIESKGAYLKKGLFNLQDQNSMIIALSKED